MVMNIAQKYYALVKYLNEQKSQKLILTFAEIESILGQPLPSSAYKYSAWWANGGHVEAEAWLNAGFKADEVKLGESVVFIKESIISTAKNQQGINSGSKYRHFKGKEYLVLYLAKHSETLENMVVYQALYGERGIWVRPLSMFLEQVEVNGKMVNRFEEIKES